MEKDIGLDTTRLQNNCDFSGWLQFTAEHNNLVKVNLCETREQLKQLLDTGLHLTIRWLCLKANLITIHDTKYNWSYTEELKEIFLNYKFPAVKEVNS